jgi:S1-C subfamily serine protease
MMQQNRGFNPPPQPRPRYVNLPLIIILVCLVVLAIWLAQDRWGNFFDPHAEPRAITPRGNLTDVEESNIAVFENVSPSVVFITTLEQRTDFFGFNVYQIPRGQGSGFIWDREGHLVTNFHVVEHAVRSGSKVRVRLAGGSEYDALVLGFDRHNDLAVLQINAHASELTPIPIGTSNDLRVGQMVFAIGNPFGFDHSFTKGVVSALERDLMSQDGQKVSGLIQTDADINPGNSGGPLLDSASRLIGVNTFIYSPRNASQTNTGLGFAVPVDTINAIIPQILRSGSAGRAGLGVVAFADSTTRRLGYDEGVLIKEVYKGSAAEKAGVRSARLSRGGRYFIGGDLLINVDEHKILTRSDLTDVMGQYNVGDEVKITIRRDDELYRATVRLQAMN